jgi:hypothetical protein
MSGFSPTIDQGVWDSLMQQTSAPVRRESATSYKNADGNLVRAKFKAPLRDAVKVMIGFNQHKSGQVNCSALDRSISAGNRLLALDKKQLEDEIGREVDFRVTNARRKYAAQMLNQYTNELERKRESNCRTSGDKELDYSQQERDNTLSNLGSQGQFSPSMQVQQAGMGGNTMVYLAIGAIALAGFFFLKSTMNKGGAPAPAPAPAPASTPTPSA